MNQAVATAAALTRAQVICAASGAPQDELRALLASQCQGAGRGRFIAAESGRSALACAAGAAQAGARVFAAASAEQLAAAQDILFWTAYARLPIVLACASGAMGPAAGTQGDMTGVAAQRDTGWITLLCRTDQEIIDSAIIARRLAEKARLPAMVCYDPPSPAGDNEGALIPEEKSVDRFLGEPLNEFAIDLKNPRALCPYVGPDYDMEFRHKIGSAHKAVEQAFADAAGDFSRAFDRKYRTIEEIGAKDAETVVVASGAIAESARTAVEDFRQRGESVGLIKMRMLSPTPVAEIRDAIAGMKAGAKRLVVIDSSPGHGLGGALAQEIKAALAGIPGAPITVAVHAGMGGRIVGPADIATACSRAREADAGAAPIWIGLRE